MGWFGRATATELRRELLRLEETERAGWLIAAREESCGRPLCWLGLMGAACGWGDSSEDWQQPWRGVRGAVLKLEVEMQMETLTISAHAVRALRASSASVPAVVRKSYNDRRERELL